MIDKEQFMQVVIVAWNADDIAERYCRLFGINLPEKKMMSSEKGGVLYPYYYKGKLTLNTVIKSYTLYFKEVVFEIIEPVSGESIWHDYIIANGQGLHNIGFFVEDIKDGCREIINEGGILINHGYFPDQCYALLDAEKTLGARINIKQVYQKESERTVEYKEYDTLMEE